MTRLVPVDPDTFGTRLQAAGFEVLEVQKNSQAFDSVLGDHERCRSQQLKLGNEPNAAVNIRDMEESSMNTRIVTFGSNIASKSIFIGILIRVGTRSKRLRGHGSGFVRNELGRNSRLITGSATGRSAPKVPLRMLTAR